ncbi:TetR/AcrR family transcriptional regulator [Funiculus sociatus GB2-A5]|uniref:TetR/AcrR family transcriptional regulator n=1 Tax=Funiculus sociatus GB2-A5 TaxID=2933946 RepID=A0ABV0JVN4_9CYAN|nr:MULTISPECIES: TetR/AcrR family transcriptional regulator [unclassified Trichocoleus]MBD1905498.1 TetR family transcriptional regulator [Trichocoleus sp. FACHB-832]MBD2062355.1 TetR family transcriptional regulator [Trichocoleus sp. FACHB-6]
MSTPRNPTRQRLIDAALKLFAAQGVTETTTKQIAELADVNEVTLFRHFGNKHGLLLAVIQEAAVFAQLGQTLVQQADQASSLEQALKEYADACLQALERVPEMVRSVVGEAGQYPAENREALGRGFTQANRYVAEYLKAVIDGGQLQAHLPAEKLASLLNGMLLGYAVIEFTSEFHDLWQDREDFLENLVTLFLQGAVSPNPVTLSHAIQLASLATNKIADLPARLVHSILQKAKKQGLQEYALVYVLFGAGLTPAEITQLERSHYISDRDQQFLQITKGLIRQVPVNQWIMGKRYGTYQKNPLTQWLRSRKDTDSALFINAAQQPLTEAEVRQLWQELTTDLIAPEGRSPTIEQVQQTWCVEMLMRGMNLEDMQILTGWENRQLEPYIQKAKEKAALEQAIRLDQKS